MPSRSRRLPHLRHLWDPPGGAEVESAMRDVTVRDMKGQRPPARPPASAARALTARHRDTHRARGTGTHRERHRAQKEEGGPATLASPGGRASPTPVGQRASAASRGRLQGRAPPAASRLSPPSLGCPARPALVLCLLVCREPFKRDITFANRRPPAGAQAV